jgi:hypothetical protein
LHPSCCICTTACVTGGWGETGSETETAEAQN